MKALKITLLATAFAIGTTAAMAQSASGNATMNPPGATQGKTNSQGDPAMKKTSPVDKKADVKVKGGATTGSGAAASGSTNSNLSGTSSGQGSSDPAAKGNSPIKPGTKTQ